MSELSLDSRYIHTGNSGVTIRIDRDVKRPDRAVLKIENGAMGAFSTSMKISGNSYEGMTSDQLRDIALCFLEAASNLDSRKTDLNAHAPHVADADPLDMRVSFLERSLPRYIRDLLPNEGTTVITGKDSTRKVNHLVQNIPDIIPFYAALLEEFRSPRDTSSAIKQSRPKDRNVEFSPSDLERERAKRKLVIYYGLRLLRSLHAHSLVTSHMEEARSSLASALSSNPTPEEEAEICMGVDLAEVCYKKTPSLDEVEK